MISNSYSLPSTESNLSFLSRNPVTYQGNTISREKWQGVRNGKNKKDPAKPRDPFQELRQLMGNLSSIIGEQLKAERRISRQSPNLFDQIDQLKKIFGDHLENTIERLLNRLANLIHNACKQGKTAQQALENFYNILIKNTRKTAEELFTDEAFQELYPAVLASLQNYITNGGEINSNVANKLEIHEVQHSDVASGWEADIMTEPSAVSPYQNGDRSLNRISSIMPSMKVNLKNLSERQSPYNQIRTISFEVDDAEYDIQEPFPTIKNAYLTDKEALRKMHIEMMDGTQYDYSRPDQLPSIDSIKVEPTTVTTPAPVIAG